MNQFLYLKTTINESKKEILKSQPWFAIKEITVQKVVIKINCIKRCILNFTPKYPLNNTKQDTPILPIADITYPTNKLNKFSLQFARA